MTHYETLGIPEAASESHVIASYRLLAMAFHPDRLSGLSEAMRQQAGERLKVINAAYAVLKNPVSRARYDSELAGQRGSWVPPNPTPPPEALCRMCNVNPVEHTRLGLCFECYVTSDFVLLQCPCGATTLTPREQVITLCEGCGKPIRARQPKPQPEPEPETWTVYCCSCGKPHPSNESRCSSCGSLYNAKAPPQPPPQPPRPAHSPRSVIACAVGVLILVMIFAYGSKDASPVSASPTVLHGTDKETGCRVKKEDNKPWTWDGPCPQAFLPKEDPPKQGPVFDPSKPYTKVEPSKPDRKPQPETEPPLSADEERCEQAGYSRFNTECLAKAASGKPIFVKKPPSAAPQPESTPRLPQEWEKVPGKQPLTVYLLGDNTLKEEQTQTSKDGNVLATTFCSLRPNGKPGWDGTCVYTWTWSNPVYGGNSPGREIFLTCRTETAEHITTLSAVRIAGTSQLVDVTPLRLQPPQCPVPGTESIEFTYTPRGKQ